MVPPTRTRLSVLRVNVTGLLRSTPGALRTYPVAGERLDLGAGLRQAAPLAGTVRLARTNRGILVEAHLTTALAETCSRCLGATAVPIAVDIFEEALPSVDLETGGPLDLEAEPDVLRLDDHHELDLEVPVREAVSLGEPLAPLCRAACAGLCPECGRDLNDEPHAHPELEGDPRLAPLARLLADEKE